MVGNADISIVYRADRMVRAAVAVVECGAKR